MIKNFGTIYVSEETVGEVLGKSVRIRDIEIRGGPYYEIRRTFFLEALFENRSGLFDIGAEFSLGGYEFEIVDMPVFGGYCVVVLKNSRWRWWYVWWYKMGQKMKLFNERLIVTFMIWGLGDYNPACIPAWEDIYFVRWFKKWIKPEERG